MLGNTAMGIIFPNNHDEALPSLSRNRTMGSIPFGGRYRMIDFSLSAMSHAGISKVGIIVKSNYLSLMDHIGNGREWDLSRKVDGVTIFPPYGGGEKAYSGKVEAFYNILPYLTDSKEKYVIISDCDLACNIDYKAFIEYHIANNADVSVMYRSTELSESEKRDNITYEIGDGGRVTQMLFNDQRTGVRNLAMNIMIIEREFLIALVKDAYSRRRLKLERDVLANGLGITKVMAYEFKDYCSKISDMKSYFDANIALLCPDNLKALFNKTSKIYTKVRDNAPASYAIGAKVNNSLISDGCRIDGTVINSVLSRGVRVGKGAVVKNCVLLQDTEVGENCDLEYVVTDKRVKVSDDKKVCGSESYPVFIEKNALV